MVERKLYAKYFEPIVQPGEYLELYPSNKKKYVLADAIYPLPLLVVDLCDADHLNTTVTTTESGEVEIDDVYVDDNELVHMRMIPYDDFSVTWLAKPKSRVYLTIKNKTWKIPKLDDPMGVAVEFFNLNEVFQLEDTEMWAKVTANAGTLTQARLLFFGYRFILKDVTSVPSGVKPTKIPVEGYPGTS